MPGSNISSIELLKDGRLFSSLVNMILSKGNDLYTIHEDDNFFPSIKLAIEKFHIHVGIDYDKAQHGNEFELAKISLVILSNGIAVENECIIKSCERLNLDLYEIMTNFYSIVEKNKSKFPPHSIDLYEKLLMDKNMIFCSNPFSTSSSSSLSSAYNCKISSLPHDMYSFNDDEAIYSSIKLSSDVLREENSFLEKRNFENKLHQKDIIICQLENELDEKQDKINFLLRTLTELKQMRDKMNEDLAIEHDILVNELEQEKRSKIIYEQKCRHLSHLLREKNEKQTILEKMNASLLDKLEKFNKKHYENKNDFKQLQLHETKMKSEFDSKFLNEQLLIGLFNQCKLLDLNLITVSQNLEALRYEYGIRIEEISNTNVAYQNKISSLESKLELFKEYGIENVIL